jgi:hypothetical protein
MHWCVVQSRDFFSHWLSLSSFAHERSCFRDLFVYFLSRFSPPTQSVFGWGMAGAVALKADKLRWIPGQKKARYDIAGAVTMLTVGLIKTGFAFIIL